MSESNHTIFSIESVSKYYTEEHSHLHVLNGINFSIKKGEFIILLGPSGSGKSTLLRVLSGLEPYDGGNVIKSPNIKAGFIFQNFAIFTWLNVLDNVAFGLKMQGMSERERHHIARTYINEMGLTGFEHAYPRELSGGMKQRVGIARALAIQPNVLFMDEPFSALDSFTANRLREEILRIWKMQNLTIVMVSHLIEEAILLGDKIVALTPIPAKVEHIFENTLPRPRNKRSPEFFNLYDKIEKVIRF